MDRLKKIGIIPIDKEVLYSQFDELKQPKDKITDLEKKGLVIRIKRDLYVVSKKVHHLELSRELIANHLYSPSYVSLESALAYHGLIPERVFSLRSVSLKTYKKYETPLGVFEYIKVPDRYFQVGIHQEIVNEAYCFLIASPEKALCDLIVSTRNLRIQSVSAIRTYLEEDIRFDMDALTSFNTEIVRQCYETGKKKTELLQLLNLLSDGK